jgi:single-strand DNA-binding protein
MKDEQSDEGGNAVTLSGRLSVEPTARDLPSGTPIVSFRVVIPRSATVMTKGSHQRSDWIDVTAWSSLARRRASSWHLGDIVLVTGALRRRHYRAGEINGSRVEIEMLGGRLLERAAAKRTAEPETESG